MFFSISKEKLAVLQSETAHVEARLDFAFPECPGGSCGNNCSGTCATSPCTNVAAATGR